MPSTERDYSEALVLRVNELVHDFLGSTYRDEVESEMHIVERQRWLDLWRRAEPAPPRRIIDIGTGTGFVPLTLLPMLSASDHFICSDVSATVLDLARSAIAEIGPEAEVEYVHLDGRPPFRLPFENNSADVITFNSVLHHLKDTEGFLAEIDRVLRPGGLLMVGHEPNRRFREHTLLNIIFWTTRFLLLPKEGLVVLLRNIGLYDPILALRKKLGKKGEETITDYVNRHVLSEGLIDRPLRPSEVPAITDILDEEGFYPEKLLPGWEMIHLETYNHLRTVDTNHGENRFVRSLSRWARRRYPEAGATFFALYRKPV